MNPLEMSAVTLSIAVLIFYAAFKLKSMLYSVSYKELNKGDTYLKIKIYLVLKYLWLSRSYLGSRKISAFQDQQFRNKDYGGWRDVSMGLPTHVEDLGFISSTT